MKTEDEIARELKTNNPSQAPNYLPAPAASSESAPHILFETSQGADNEHGSFDPHAQTDSHNAFLMKVINFSRIVKWITLIDAMLTFFYLLGPAWFLVSLALFPILGFFGAVNIHKCLTLAYLLYLSGSMLTRLVLILVFPSILYAIFSGLTILFELYLFITVLRFFRLIFRLSDADRQAIRTFKSLDD